jgi:hypothetical protein
MRFTIKGKEFDITTQEIVAAIKGNEPRLIKKSYVEIEGTRYPVKQVVELVTGSHPIAFTSMYANDILSKLGFKVKAI